jgi:hypothetical protein
MQASLHTNPCHYYSLTLLFHMLHLQTPTTMGANFLLGFTLLMSGLVLYNYHPVVKPLMQVCALVQQFTAHPFPGTAVVVII